MFFRATALCKGVKFCYLIPRGWPCRAVHKCARGAPVMYTSAMRHTQDSCTVTQSWCEQEHHAFPRRPLCRGCMRCTCANSPSYIHPNASTHFRKLPTQTADQSSACLCCLLHVRWQKLCNAVYEHSHCRPESPDLSQCLQEEKNRDGPGDTAHKQQPAQRSQSLLRPNAFAPSARGQPEPSKPAHKRADSASHPHSIFVAGGSLSIATPLGAAAPVKPNQATGTHAAEAAAATVCDPQPDEEAEEGELEPGERAAGWDSGPEEEAGSAAQHAGNPGKLGVTVLHLYPSNTYGHYFQRVANTQTEGTFSSGYLCAVTQLPLVLLGKLLCVYMTCRHTHCPLWLSPRDMSKHCIVGPMSSCCISIPRPSVPGLLFVGSLAAMTASHCEDGMASHVMRILGPWENAPPCCNRSKSVLDTLCA